MWNLQIPVTLLVTPMCVSHTVKTIGLHHLEFPDVVFYTGVKQCYTWVLDTGYYIQESSIVMCIVLYRYCNIVGAICTASSKQYHINSRVLEQVLQVISC